MIQRIQTVWLLLAAVCAGAITRAPLFNATLPNQVKQVVMASEYLAVYALSIVIGIVALVAIFLFKKRTVQYKIAVVGVLGSIAILGLMAWHIEAFKKATVMAKGFYNIGVILPIVMVILFWLAARAIRRDEKLIKSLERLR